MVGIEYTTWVGAQILGLGLILNKRLPRVVAFMDAGDFERFLLIFVHFLSVWIHRLLKTLFNSQVLYLLKYLSQQQNLLDPVHYHFH